MNLLRRRTPEGGTNLTVGRIAVIISSLLLAGCGYLKNITKSPHPKSPIVMAQNLQSQVRAVCGIQRRHADCEIDCRAVAINPYDHPFDLRDSLQDLQDPTIGVHYACEVPQEGSDDLEVHYEYVGGRFNQTRPKRDPFVERL